MALKIRKNRAQRPVDVTTRRTSLAATEECPLNRAMVLLSGAWATHVIYYLSEQPRRFGELRIDIADISARVLSQRLRELEAKGVVHRTVMPTSPPSVEYGLTELGRALLPAIMAIADVGRRLETRAAIVRPRRAATREKSGRAQ